MFKQVKPIKNPAPYTHGNAVKLIRGGVDYFDLLEKLISAARHSIHFQVYIFDDDETGKRISNALKEAAARGVKVYVMLDAYASKKSVKSLCKGPCQVRDPFQVVRPDL
ncbi:MAG: phospholipase D-like domain-containing protein [Bacteroidota bacterium]